ncbi:MAG: prevent-host-death protein [Chloroflexi bacterium]|nr:prevent-host-death protein [Chloroflexota bacterium]
MQFVPYRFLRNQPGELRKRLQNENELVVTSNGEPFALMIRIDPQSLEQTTNLVAQIRAQQALSTIRAEARQRGLDRLSLEEINSEIQTVRQSHAGES